MKFGDYIINEEKSYLGNKIGDVLTSLQDVQSDIDNLGARHLSRLAESIVNQIRKILHSGWNPKYNKRLERLQNIAVAIQKTIEERGDLKEIIPAATAELERISGELGVKINNLKAPFQDQEDIQDQDFQPTQEPDMQEPAGQEPDMQEPGLSL
jgi:hypothetical protein